MSRRQQPTNNPTTTPTPNPTASPTAPSAPQPQPALKDGRPTATLKSRPTISAITGSLSLSLPLATPASRGGFQPTLNLNYDSSAGHTPFGLGWRLGVDSISRKTSRNVPRYDDTDIFTLSGADDLVASETMSTVGPWTVRRYQPRVETAIVRVERWENEEGVHWRTITAENVTTVFGRDDASRVREGQRVFSWLACESWDANGNHMLFSYKREDAAGVAARDVAERGRNVAAGLYLKRIKYGNRVPNRDLETWETVESQGGAGWLFEVVFDYGEHDATAEEVREWGVRREPVSNYSAGFEVRMYRLCKRVLMFHHMPEMIEEEDTLVASTAFTYDESAPSGTAVLTNVVRSGHRKGSTQSLPPVEFTYTAVPALNTLLPVAADTSAIPYLPTSNSTSTQFLDLNGEGSPGLLTRRGETAWTYTRNLSALNGTPSFAAEQVLPSLPALADAASYFEDLDGDGRAALVTVDERGGIKGYHLRAEDDGWENFIPFGSIPNVDVQDPHVKRIDLTGDGKADLLILGEGGMGGWYPSLASGGFGPRQATFVGPEVSQRGGDAEVYTADMSGDGLADVVQISNGAVWYWPNMGHGRFGERVVMGNAPALDRADQFTHERVRLVDVDGSGTTDLIYLMPGGGAAVYYNRAGNRWSEADLLPAFPALDSVADVQALDLLGQGTACLVWTSPGAAAGTAQMRYVDLMGGRKPGMLTGMANGLGAATEVAYVPSTRFYLDDERAGRAWATRLAFPVMCVERATYRDLVAGTESTMRYRYHDGYYDGVEREFRGFGMVETWDAADYAVGVGAAFKRPPVYTKSWFHTGAPLPAFPAPLLEQSVLPAWTSRESYRDANRALRGKPRRQEVYADDKSKKAGLPYIVAEQNYEVRRVRETGGPGVYRVVDREELTCNAERGDGEDARIEHQVVLEANEHGQTTKSASINYGRKSSTLTDAGDVARQQETVVVYVEQDYTNDIDSAGVFRAPQPAEERRYRVLGAGSGRMEFASLVNDNFAFFRDAALVPVETADAGTGRRKVLVAKNRVYYRSSDLKAQLPLRTLELHSVVSQSFTLALTAGNLDVLSSVLPTDGDRTQILSKDGGYKEIDGDGNWWIPSARSLFSGTVDGDELQAARSSFYTPVVAVDPFGARATKSFDAFFLLPVQTVDAVGNTTTFTNDYISLQPTLTTDLNGNRVQIAIDCFGRQVGAAMMGKVDETVGDSLEGFEAVLTEAQHEAFLSDPAGPLTRTLLNGAGVRKIYGTARYHHTRSDGEQTKPAFEALITRDVHGAADTPIGVKITYLDGSGDAGIQEATLEEAGKWRFSGWVINDNKNQPVRQFLPFFADSHEYRAQTNPPADAAATTLLRDPVGRPVGTLYPDASWSKMVHGPWSTENWDAGDTVLVEDPAQDEDVGACFLELEEKAYLPTWHQRMAASTDRWERDAARKAEVYAGTPRVMHLDALGRVIVSVADNGKAGKLTERGSFDLTGNHESVWDALGRIVKKCRYDMAGRGLYEVGMDSGERWMLSECLGQPMISWNARGMRRETKYDELRRVDRQFLIEKPGEEEITVVSNFYGDVVEPGISAARNTRGKLFQCDDQAGRIFNAQFDFKGNCTTKHMAVAVEYKTTLDWAATPLPALEEQVTSTAEFDARNREWKTTAGDGSITQRTYSLSGQLQTVSFAHSSAPTVWTPYITASTYAADGQLTSITYGNTARTENTYHPHTRALINAKTTRADGKVLRNLTYTHDSLGRVTHTVDAALQEVYFRNAKISPDHDYRYDAVGQLVEAHGREQVDVANGGGRGLKPYSAAGAASAALPGDGNGLCEYEETYTYDAVGNLLALSHAATSDASLTGWTRRYFYEEPSVIEPERKNNRLSRTTVGGVTENYGYDDDAGRHGCMTAMPGFSVLKWDFNDRLRSSAQQQANNGVPETTYYVYDSAGTRTRKVTERANTGTKLKETRYLPGYDLYTTYAGNGTTTLSRTTSQVTDGAGTVARVEYTPATKLLLPRYQTSENLELDDTAQIVTYAEYSPFGALTYSARRSAIEADREYRFARYQQDTETGLYHCGERYYAAHLGRWTSPDPIGIGDGLNVYCYVSNDPVNYDDSKGTNRGWRALASFMSSAFRGAQGQGRPAGAALQLSRQRPSTAQQQYSGIQRQYGIQGGLFSSSRLSLLSRASFGEQPTAPTGYSAWFTTRASDSDSPSSDGSTRDPTDGYTTLYRFGSAERAQKFVEENDVGTVTTWSVGDFNHIPKTAAYFTNDPRSTLQRAKAGDVIIQLKVPNSLIYGPNTLHFPPEPTAAWAKRVNMDRMGQEYDPVDQSKEVIVGPESNMHTEHYTKAKEEGRQLEIQDMTPLFREGNYVQQFVFKGEALKSLAGMEKQVWTNSGGLKPYPVKERAPIARQPN